MSLRNFIVFLKNNEEYDNAMLIQIFLHKIYDRLGWRRLASLLWHVTCHVVVTCLLLTRVPLPCRLVNPGFPLSTLFVAFVIIIISRILIVALIIIMIISIQFNVVHTAQLLGFLALAAMARALSNFLILRHLLMSGFILLRYCCHWQMLYQ